MKKALNISIDQTDRSLLEERAKNSRETIGQYLIKSALMRAGEIPKEQ